MSTEIGADSVIVTHSPMTPAAADAFRVFWETMGDNATWLETPEAQRKILDYVTNEAVQDYIFQWEDPAPLESNEDLPPFPVDGMPEILKSTVTELAEELQVPVDLVAVMALAVLSASLVGRVRIGVHGGWEEQVTIYALGLAESGNRKSGVVKGLKAALDNAEKAVRETTESERVKKVIARSAAESLAKNLEGRANKSTDPMDLAIHIQAAQARAEAEAIEVPHEADLVLTDATPREC